MLVKLQAISIFTDKIKQTMNNTSNKANNFKVECNPLLAEWFTSDPMERIVACEKTIKTRAKHTIKENRYHGSLK